MPPRIIRGKIATAPTQFRLTPTAEGRLLGLAHYFREPYSAMLRRLAEKKRRTLVEQGKRPPLRPPEDWARIGKKPRSATQERATCKLIVSMTPEEKARVEGLAYALGCNLAELWRLLSEEERQRLYDQEGRRAPVRPPSAESEISDSRGAKSPRR